MPNPDIWKYAGKGAPKLRGRSQTAEHVAKRVASFSASLAKQRRHCVRCNSEYTPTSGSQRYCNLGCWTASATSKKARLHRISVSKTAYTALVEKFGTACCICGDTPTYRLAVDHCHQSGRIRGLLCHRCNTAIGLMRDSVETLQAAISYLNKQEN